MYPVMFPIYIAEFEHATEARTWKYQVVMDAHDERVSFAQIVVFGDADSRRQAIVG